MFKSKGVFKVQPFFCQKPYVRVFLILISEYMTNLHNILTYVKVKTAADDMYHFNSQKP